MSNDKDKPCDSTQPTGNIKCVIISVILASGYWFLPPKNKWILAFILYFTYIAIAWYDHWYQCKRTFGPTYLRLFYEWAKPPTSDQSVTYSTWCKDIENKVLTVDIIIALVLMAFVPYFLKLPIQRKKAAIIL
jgi:hypothetical protein